MAEQAKIDLLIEGGAAAKTLGELRDNARAVEEALEGASIGSEEYKKLNQQLIQTNKQVKNLELGFEALDSEQVASEIGSVAGAIGDVATGLVLVSGGNKSLEEMAHRIETALGVSMALKGSIEGLQSARKLYNDSLVRGNKLTTAAIALQNTFNKLSAGAQAGVLLLVTAVVALAAAIGRWASQSSVAEQTQEKLNEATLAGVEAAGKEEAKLKVLTTTLLSAAKGTQARTDALKALNDVIPDSIGYITEETIATGEAIEVIQEYIKVVKQRAELTALENLLAEQIGERVKLQAQLQGEGNELTDQAIALSKEAENQILQQINALQKNISAVEGTNEVMVRGQEIQKEDTRLKKENTKVVKENTDAKDEAEKAAELAAQKEADRLLRIAEQEEALAIRRQNAKDRLNQILRDKDSDAFQLQMDQLTAQHQAEMDMLAEFIPEENELRLELEAQYQERLLEIREAAAEEDKRITKEQEDEKTAARENAAKQSVEAAQNLVNIAESLNSAFHSREVARIKEKQKNGEKLTASEQKRLDKEAKMQKAFAVAQLAIDTAKGIAGAVSSGASQPYPLNIIAIVTGVAAVLANLAAASAALKTPLPSAASVGGGDISSAATDAQNQTTAPVIDEFETGTSLLNDPQKVFVVESDITNTQNNVASIEESFTYG